MLHLFNTQGFYIDRPIKFSVSKISTNLYLADSNDQMIKSFIVKKTEGKWISDNEMTQSITLNIGKSIDRIDKDKMRKINEFVRSCFAPSPAEDTRVADTTIIQNLARI
ncbi:MAG: hypothetical protein ABI151_04775 [Chitinophagaceae bacterium]